MPLPILLVDDDALYREVLTADLEDRGVAVTAFADGPNLLAALAGDIEAELVLVDWTLPYLSGPDLLRALRRGGCQLPVAFLTGRSGVEHLAEARAAGAVDFIDKSCDIDELVQRLRRIAGR